MNIQPYLNFDGRCDEAIEFYKSAVGARVNMLMRYKDCPEPPGSRQFGPELLDKVMHASLRIGDSTLFVSDGRCMGQAKFAGITLSLSVSSDADAERVFAALGEGGKVTMPMSKTFFASSFGMLQDRFGVSWMVVMHA